MDEYIELAKEIRAAKHPSCNFLFLAGSLIRGEGTRFSDLDIVVIYEKVEKAYRESFIFNGVMVETFVHDPETVDFFVDEFDKQDGNSALAQMIVEGIEIPSATILSQQLKAWARESILRGPDACNQQEIMNMRYAVTNIIDDIRDYRSESELLGSLTCLYSSLAQFFFRANRHWNGGEPKLC